MRDFLEAHDFKDVGTSAKKSNSFTSWLSLKETMYPLHVAASHGNYDIVRLLSCHSGVSIHPWTFKSYCNAMFHFHRGHLGNRIQNWLKKGLDGTLQAFPPSHVQFFSVK